MASSGMLISDTCSCSYHANTAVDACQTFVRWLNDVLQSNWTGDHDCYTSSGMVILNISSTQTLTGVLRVYIDDKLAGIN